MEQILYNMLVCTGGILLTLLLSCILARRYSVRWRYYIWLVFLIRLLLPVDISLPFAYVPESTLEASLDTVPGNITRVLNRSHDSRPAGEGKWEESEVRGSYVVDGDTNRVSYVPLLRDTDEKYSLLLLFRENVKPMIYGLWLAVAVFLFVRQWLLYGLSMRRIKRSCRPVTAGPVPGLVGEIAAQLKLRRIPECFRCPLIRSPMTVGLFRSRLLLPSGADGSGETWEQKMSPEAVKYVLQHELVHVRHCHGWIKVAASVVQALYWFNPVIFFMRHMLDEDMEIICDNYVVKDLSEKERAAYNHILLRCASGEEALRYASGFSGAQTRTLKRRFYENLWAHKRKKGRICFVLVAGMMAASLMSVAWGRDLGALVKSERRARADNYIEEYLCQDLARDETVFPKKMDYCGIGEEDELPVAVGYSEENGGEIWRSRWFNRKWTFRLVVPAETLRQHCPELTGGASYSLRIFQGQDGGFYLSVVLYDEEGRQVRGNLLYWLDIYSGRMGEVFLPQPPEHDRTAPNALRVEVFYDGNLLVQDGEDWYVYNPRKGSWVCRLEYQGRAGNMCAGNGVVYRLYLGDGEPVIYRYDEYSGQRKDEIRLETGPQDPSQIGYAGLSCRNGGVYFGCGQGLWCAETSASAAARIINGDAPGTLAMGSTRNRMTDIIPMSDGSFIVRYQRVERAGAYLYCSKEFIIRYTQAGENGGER